LIASVVTENGGESGGVDIYLERVDRPDAPSIWLFSRQTLADIPEVYEQINSTTVEHMLPATFLKKYFSVTLFGWCYFLVFLPALYLVLSAISRVLGFVLGYGIRRWTRHREAPNPTPLPHPLRLLILSLTIFATISRAGLSLVARQAGGTVGKLLLIVAFVWAMFLVNARIELYLRKRMESRGRLSSTAVLRPARRVLDFIAIVAGLIFLLHTFGIDPSATLAGLGVGGIAIALAAQKTLENVIGGASLIMDGAVRVGDSFKAGEVVGTIESVGLRSTMIRTMDRTVVTIPNGQMATMVLENYSARDRFWLRQLIQVEHQTSSFALNSLLVDVRSLLEKDERVLPGTTRVRLLRFTESNLELEVFAYLTARDWNHFLEVQEDMLMRIRELLGSAGVQIAYPTRAIFVKNESKADSAPVRSKLLGTIAGEEQVHEMRTREQV